MAHSLPFFITGKDVFEYIERQFVRAIKGEIQSQAVAVNVREGFISFIYCILTSMSTDVYSYHCRKCTWKVCPQRCCAASCPWGTFGSLFWKQLLQKYNKSIINENTFLKNMLKRWRVTDIQKSELNILIPDNLWLVCPAKTHQHFFLLYAAENAVSLVRGNLLISARRRPKLLKTVRIRMVARRTPHLNNASGLDATKWCRNARPLLRVSDTTSGRICSVFFSRKSWGRRRTMIGMLHTFIVSVIPQKGNPWSSTFITCIHNF